MKGLFIPGVTTEEFRKVRLEGVEALMAEGTIYDVDIPIIEGRKTVINDKLAEIKNLAPGTIIEFGGTQQWEILDNHFPVASGGEGVFCLAKDILFYKAFDERNRSDWRVSTLRDYLNNGDFESTLEARMLLPFKRDLTSDDGLKDYEECIDYISLISCDEYRRYRKYISSKSDWWWTNTPWSTPSSDYLCSVCAVAKDGSLNNNTAYLKDNGVVPVICVHPSLKVGVIERSEVK